MQNTIIVTKTFHFHILSCSIPDEFVIMEQMGEKMDNLLKRSKRISFVLEQDYLDCWFGCGFNEIGCFSEQ